MHYSAKICFFFATILSLLSYPEVTRCQPIPATESKLKLSGEALLGITSYTGVKPTLDRVSSQTVFDNRIRLNLETKFTPHDRFKIRLETGNSIPLNSQITGTNMTRLGYDGAKNGLNLALLKYQFPVSSLNSTQVTIDITGNSLNDNLDNCRNPLDSSSSGAISRFGRYQPICRLSNDGSGITLKHQFSPQWAAIASYSAPSLIAANASNGGLFGGANSAIAQVNYSSPHRDVNLGFTYARSYHPNGSGVTGFTGSNSANNPFNGRPTTAQHYGINTSYQIAKNLTLSGWWGMTNAQPTNRQEDSQSTNYALSLAADNFGNQGNTLGIIIGVPPKSNRDRDTSLHLEAIYKIKANDNLEITPGLLVITNPEHNSNNAPIWVGTIRTTWKF
jgi:hypothetical protein